MYRTKMKEDLENGARFHQCASKNRRRYLLFISHRLLLILSGFFFPKVDHISYKGAEKM